jgi:hypothetical protein
VNVSRVGNGGLLERSLRRSILKFAVTIRVEPDRDEGLVSCELSELYLTGYAVRKGAVVGLYRQFFRVDRPVVDQTEPRTQRARYIGPNVALRDDVARAVDALVDVDIPVEPREATENRFTSRAEVPSFESFLFIPSRGKR